MHTVSMLIFFNVFVLLSFIVGHGQSTLLMVQRHVSKDNHPHILPLIKAVESGPTATSQHGDILLVSEFCDGGTLSDLILTTDFISPDFVSQYLHQTSSALDFLHSQTPKIIHRDVKAENFLVTASRHLKLCDFGSATSDCFEPAEMNYQQKMQTAEQLDSVSTPQYRSPEMVDLFSEQPINEKLDIWALGVILYLMCFKTLPFPDGSRLGITNLQFSKTGHNPALGKFVSYLTENLLIKEVMNRPTAGEVDGFAQT
eukprot:m.174519 g.174519  ORF g.174519 m.174519 type:complete len:257 (-) comp14592_c0_seq6:77-847(-)